MSRQAAQEGVSCYVCQKQRAPGELRPKPSKLIKGNNLLICTPCDAAGKEPRGYIIAVARSKGWEVVKEYISKHRYEGAPITGAELLK